MAGYQRPHTGVRDGDERRIIFPQFIFRFRGASGSKVFSQVNTDLWRSRKGIFSMSPKTSNHAVLDLVRQNQETGLCASFTAHRGVVIPVTCNDFDVLRLPNDGRRDKAMGRNWSAGEADCGGESVVS
jgi:hypothetical protein